MRNFKGREVLGAKSFKESVKYKLLLCEVFGKRADGRLAFVLPFGSRISSKKPSTEVFLYIFEGKSEEELP